MSTRADRTTSTLADRTIAALRSNHDELAARVREFNDQDLARQSGSSQWDVAQVLSHLGSGAEIGLATLQSGLAGRPGPDQDFSQSVWDRWNAMSPQEKATGFLRAGEMLVTRYENLDAATRQELHVKMAFLPFPADVALMSGMRLYEATLHSWDVRVALDQHATLNTQEVDAALDQLIGPLNFMVGFLGKPEALSGTHATLRVETADPHRVLKLVLGPTISLSDEPADSDDVLTAPAEALLRLLGGRLNQMHTPETLTITSDVVTLDQLRRIFPGI